MARLRQTQHKTERETMRGRELSDVKRENNQLRRKLARLEKELAKTVREVPEPDEPAVEAPPEPAKRSCACGSFAFTVIKGPTRSYTYCRDCAKRQD